MSDEEEKSIKEAVDLTVQEQEFLEASRSAGGNDINTVLCT